MDDEDRSDDLEADVKDLVQQLKDDTKNIKETAQSEEFKLNPEDLEQFIIDKTGALVNSSIDMVNTVKQYVEAAPNPEDVESLASLLKAATGSIDTLSKVFIQNKKTNTSIEMKKMDIDSKKQLLDQDHQNKLLLSREDVLDELLSNAKVIEAEIVDSDDQDKI